MLVSKNRGGKLPPNHPILVKIGFGSNINHPCIFFYGKYICTYGNLGGYIWGFLLPMYLYDDYSYTHEIERIDTNKNALENVSLPSSIWLFILGIDLSKIIREVDLLQKMVDLFIPSKCFSSCDFHPIQMMIWL